MVFGKLDIHIEKKNIRHMSIAMLKNSHQMYQRLECKHRNNEMARQKYKQYPTWHWCKKRLSQNTLICPQIKINDLQVKPHKTKTLLYS